MTSAPSPRSADQLRPRSTRRRRPSRTAAVTIVAAVLALIVAAGAYAAITTPRVTLGHVDAITNQQQVPVSLHVAHAGSMTASQITATVDGAAVPTSAIHVANGTVSFRTEALNEGTHEVRVSGSGVGVLHRSFARQWRLVEDRTPPRLDVDKGSARILSRHAQVTIHVHSEAGAKLAAHDASSTTAGASGAGTLRPSLPSGRHDLAVTATDAAGNVTTQHVLALVDTAPPVIASQIPAPVKLAKPSLDITATGATPATVTAAIDGMTSAVTVAKGTTPGSFTITPTSKLAEGTHTLRVNARDQVGLTSHHTYSFLIDSTETLGANAEGLGAVGADVADLQQQLKQRGLMTSAAAQRDLARQTYGKGTQAAVKQFQSTHSMTADGLAGTDTIAALTLKIVVSTESNTLTLYRDGKVEKTYEVATGQDEYPSPHGTFYIATMEVNPWWYPPTQDAWAKNAKPTPPGPDNPLGPRFMGLGGSPLVQGVGIHGVPPDEYGSIGSHASHGCIRMHPTDAEDLFNRVQAGTTVVIQ